MLLSAAGVTFLRCPWPWHSDMLKSPVAAQDRAETPNSSCQPHHALHSYFLPLSTLCSSHTVVPCTVSAVSHLRAFVRARSSAWSPVPLSGQAAPLLLSANLCLSFKTRFRHGLQESQPEPPAGALLCFCHLRIQLCYHLGPLWWWLSPECDFLEYQHSCIHRCKHSTSATPGTRTCSINIW